MWFKLCLKEKTEHCGVFNQSSSNRRPCLLKTKFFELCGLSCAVVLYMSATDLIPSDPEILGGKPVFKGTRVPVKTLCLERFGCESA